MRSGRLIREARKHLNLSQAELGEILGKAMERPNLYSQAMVSDMERNKVNRFSPKFALALAQVLKKPLDYFEAWTHQGGAGVREEPHTHTTAIARKSKTLALGASDMMAIIDLGSRLQLEFVSTNFLPRILVLTKRPIQLLAAMEGVLVAKKEAVIEFTGENIRGRVCFFKTYGYCFVVEFPIDNPVGYIIQLKREELAMLKEKFLTLPVSVHPTD